MPGHMKRSHKREPYHAELANAEVDNVINTQFKNQKGRCSQSIL